MPPQVEETDSDVIAQQAYAEMEAEAAGKPLPEKKKPDVEAEKPSEEKPSDDTAKPSEEKVKEPVEGQEEEKPAEETSKEGEEKPKETEGKEEKKPEEKPKEDAESEAKAIELYAVKNSLTYVEAKEEIASVKALQEKYKNDPVELARALRSTTRAYDKTKAQLEQKPKEQIFQRLTDEQFLYQCKDTLAKDKDKHIEKYRATFPAKSEMMTDEAIIEDMAERGLVGYKSFADKREGEVKQKASERRETLLNTIADADKKFIPDVKAVLNETHDRSILDPKFDVADIVHWAKGQRYDADIKAAEERGFKRAKESAVILGAKETPGKSPVKSAPTSSGWAGTPDQKKRAEEMFPEDDGYAPEKAHEMFKDTFKEELKKNPKFI